MDGNIRRSMPLFPMGIVMQLTDLTARQIRYYEEHELITPARTDGNRRMYSLIDIDRLLEIKDLLDQGINMAGIKKVFYMKEAGQLAQQPFHQEEKVKTELTDAQLRRLLRDELVQAGRFTKGTSRSSDFSRFFH